MRQIPDDYKVIPFKSRRFAIADKTKSIDTYNNLDSNFKVQAYLYDVDIMSDEDINIIFNSIKKWLIDDSNISKPFVDPFSKSYKKAYTKVGRAVKIKTDIELVSDDKTEQETETGLVINPCMKSIDLNCSNGQKKEYIFITYDRNISIEEQVQNIFKFSKVKNLLFEKNGKYFKEYNNRTFGLLYKNTK